MAKLNPGYYAIIPAEVRYDTDLVPSARLLYGEITALANSTGECTAGNAYFAKLYGVNPTTVSEWIHQLEAKEYITSVVDRQAGNRRKIRIAIRENPKTSSEKAEDPSSEKAEDNNTSINNTINNKDESLKTIEKNLIAKQRAVVYALYLTRFKVTPSLDLSAAQARYRLTPGRSAAIDRRLADCGFKMVCAAIVGYSRSDWHNGTGDNHWMADLEKFILRSYEKVEAGANKYEEQQKNGGSDVRDSWAALD